MNIWGKKTAWNRINWDVSWEKGLGQRKEKKETWNNISMKKEAVVEGDTESSHSLCLPPY